MMDSLRRQFADPPNQFRFAPFWFWNHDLTDQELVWQIREMKRKGVGGFVMHPRHGLGTPYLSDEWFDRIAAAIREADRLDMKAYLYDEDNWPSGPVGGRVIEEQPAYRMAGAFVAQEWSVAGGRRTQRALETPEGLIGVVAAPEENGELAGLPESAISLMPFVEGHRLSWQAPEGRWRVMVFAKRTDPGHFHGGYLDTLNADAVRRFIELTHVPYTARFGRHFGGAVDGIFTDEPSMNYHPDDTIPWTDDLPGVFRWRHGYDLITALPAVFRPAGDRTAKIRCDYRDTATHLYETAFFRQIAEFCDSVRLNLMGHVDSEGEYYAHAREQGDFFRCAQWMHYGGVDLLFEQTWPNSGAERDGPTNNLIGPKLASSAAHLFDKPRVMCECFGLAGQWAISLRTLKWLTDWQIALGVNLMQPHAFYYSVQGFRKWECPPDEFYRMPFWPYYDALADYAGRLCTVFSGGRHVCGVAVLYTIRSMWAAMGPERNEAVDRITAGFEKVSKALMRIHRDFDYLPEEVLEEADIFDTIDVYSEDGDLLHSFGALVVPTCTTLSRETAENLRDFYESGGTLVIAGRIPDASPEEGADPWVSQTIAGIFGKVGRGKAQATNDQGGRAVYLPDLELAGEAAVEAALAEALAGTPPPVTATAKGQPVGDIVCMQYRKGDADFAFLANTSRETGYDGVEVVFNREGVPAFWDAQTGRVTEAAGWRIANGRTRLRLDFKPVESFVIALQEPQPGAPRSRRALPQPKEEVLATLADEWSFATDKPNALPLTQWRLDLESRVTWRDADEAGQTYTAEFEADLRPRTVRLAVDGLVGEKVWRGTKPLDVRVEVNGREVGPFERGEYVDHLILEADVSRHVKKGRNVVTITTRSRLYEAGSVGHAVLVLGDFSVEQRDGRMVIASPRRTMPTGSWTDAGYAYYSGIATYRQEVRLPAAKGRRLSLRLERVADLADVWVNGKQAGVLAWEPFEADITDLVRRGANEIAIKVANSMQNLLVREPRPSGLLGPVKIITR